MNKKQVVDITDEKDKNQTKFPFEALRLKYLYDKDYFIVLKINGGNFKQPKDFRLTVRSGPQRGVYEDDDHKYIPYIELLDSLSDASIVTPADILNFFTIGNFVSTSSVDGKWAEGKTNTKPELVWELVPLKFSDGFEWDTADSAATRFAAVNIVLKGLYPDMSHIDLRRHLVTLAKERRANWPRMTNDELSERLKVYGHDIIRLPERILRTAEEPGVSYRWRMPTAQEITLKP